MSAMAVVILREEQASGAGEGGGQMPTFFSLELRLPVIHHEYLVWLVGGCSCQHLIPSCSSWLHAHRCL